MQHACTRTTQRNRGLWSRLPVSSARCLSVYPTPCGHRQRDWALPQACARSSIMHKEICQSANSINNNHTSHFGSSLPKWFVSAVSWSELTEFQTVCSGAGLRKWLRSRCLHVSVTQRRCCCGYAVDWGAAMFCCPRCGLAVVGPGPRLMIFCRGAFLALPPLSGQACFSWPEPRVSFQLFVDGIFSVMDRDIVRVRRYATGLCAACLHGVR